MLGNYVDENAPCVVTTHETPLLGGDLAMNDESMAAAKALWYAVGGGTGQQNAGLQALVDQGLLSGKVGVVGALGYESLYEEAAKPILEAGGVNVVDVAYLDIINGADRSERAVCRGGDGRAQVPVGGDRSGHLQHGCRADLPERPGPHRLPPPAAVRQPRRRQLYINGEGNDLSVLENAIAVGPYDAGNLFPELGGATAECVASQEKRLGVTIIPVRRGSRR